MDYRLHTNEGDYFYFKHALDYINTRRFFNLHYHTYPEIYFFVRGKSEFIIEGATYTLEPYDIMLIPAYMLHQPYPNAGTHFERYVFNVFPGFYDKMDCHEYKKLFSDLNNFMYKIPAHIVKKTKLIDILEDMKKYSDNFKNLELPVIYCKLCEILHILNSIEDFEKFNTQNLVVQEIINYIDSNFSTITNLDELAKNFNYSKNHLGYIFKSGTGMTIPRYITLKRIELVKTLYQKGTNLTTACINAGFGNYGSFAYNYKKLFGASPRDDLKQ